MGSDLKGVIGCESTRSDSAVKLVSCYVPRGEVRRPFLYFVPSRRVILDNKPFTLNEACVAKQDGAVEEPLEKRSEALEEENPKSSPKFSSKSDIRGPKSTTKSIIKRAENSRSLTSNCSRVP